jgi:hypothetical protein
MLAGIAPDDIDMCSRHGKTFILDSHGGVLARVFGDPVDGDLFLA